MKQIIKEIKEALNASEKKTKAYDTQAEIVRVEGGTAWVHIPGGVDETPVKLTMDAKKGDVVQMRVSGGRAWLTGNKTAPPTDDATANQARSIANGALDSAEIAAEAAGRAVNSAYQAEQSAAAAQSSATNAYNAAVSAQSSADSALVSLATVEDVVGVLNWITAHGTMTLTTDTAINPAHVYFVVDPVGDYEVGGTHYSIVSEPKVADLGTYYELSVDESVQNYVATHVAVNTEGLWLIPEQNGTPSTNGKKILIATGAGSSYTTAGTYIIDRSSGVDKVLASFRANGATIGEVLNGQTRTEIGTSGMQIYQRVSGADTVIANLGYGQGTNSSGGLSNAPYYSLGSRLTTSTAYSSGSTYKIGDLCVYNGAVYVCKTAITTAEAWNSSHWQLAIGTNSTTEGGTNVASGSSSHAEGFNSIAIGHFSHAEGEMTSGYKYTIAAGEGSHAEGGGTQALGRFSHSEGSSTQAIAVASHAQNVGTIANGYAETAIGKFNIKDNYDTYALMIGNGTADNARSNALTVTWEGDVNIASGAHYKIGSANLKASDVGAVPTTRKVNGKALSSDITISASDVGLVTGTYVYNSTATDTITFQDANVNGKSFIICGCQDAGNPILRASLSGSTITVYLSGTVTIMRINYICY